MKYLIYFLYHPKGKVDDYVPHFLTAVRGQYDVIHVVSNGPLQPDQKARLHMADRLQERANEEFDVGAYKAAIFSNPDAFYRDCDEVTLANFTFFAPIGSMQPYFDWVQANPRDFWGLSAHKEMTPNPFTGTGVLPYHIQSHWISVGKRILQSGDFIDYWRTLDRIDSYQDSVVKHESQFTRHFAEKGYSYGLFFDDAPYDSAYPAFNCVDAAIAAGLPILKRRLFYHHPTVYFDNYDVNLRRALDHVSDHQLFDMNMIWDSVASTDPGTLYQAADLLRIVPDASCGPPPGDTAPLDMVLVLSRAPAPEAMAQILRCVRAACHLHLVLPEGADEGTLRALADANPMITTLTVTPCPDGGCYAALVTVADCLAAGGNAPILFALVDPTEVSRFDYGMRHLCGDASVAAHAQAELARSPHFGLALPPIRLFGAPSEADMLTEAYRNELRSDLAGMSFRARLQAPFHFSEAGVVWCRADLLAAVAQEIVTNALDVMIPFSDVSAAEGMALHASSRVVDSKKVASLMSAGLPYLAGKLDYITLVISNTREAPRNLVKAEGRVRLVSERIATKGAFNLTSQMDFLSRYATQEDREAIYAQVQKSAFEDGWAKASQQVYQKAIADGRGAAKTQIDDLTRQLAEAYDRGVKDCREAIHENVQKSAFNDGWTKASQLVYQKAFAEGRAAAQGQIDALTQQQAEAYDRGVKDCREAIFENVQKSAFNDGWSKASLQVYPKAFSEGRAAAEAELKASVNQGSAPQVRGKTDDASAAKAAKDLAAKAESFDAGFNQGWQQGAAASAEKAFDAGFHEGWAKAKQAGLGGMVARVKGKLRKDDT